MALLGIVKEVLDNIVIIETIEWPDDIPFPEMIWCADPTQINFSLLSKEKIGRTGKAR